MPRRIPKSVDFLAFAGVLSLNEASDGSASRPPRMGFGRYTRILGDDGDLQLKRNRRRIDAAAHMEFGDRSTVLLSVGITNL